MSNTSPRAPAQDVRKKRPLDLQRVTFMWDLWTGLYMLEPWEKLMFSAFWLPRRRPTVSRACAGARARGSPPSPPLPALRTRAPMLTHLTPHPCPARRRLPSCPI
jgi:hypothetical protein